MREKHRLKTARLIMVMAVLFLALVGTSVFLGEKYITSQLLQANENMTIDFAKLIANNFNITDEEVAHMKSLSFDEMEVDPVNLRLMKMCENIKMNTEISNVYIITQLRDEEVKYITDKKTSKFFSCKVGTKLDGVWLLNGKFENSKFISAKREDIYRYTNLIKSQKTAIAKRKAYGETSGDAWGTFITGYVPVYTTSGNYVGMLGIDVSPDKYQGYAQRVILMLLLLLVMGSVVTIALFLYFYFKYIKASEGKLYFDFYSRMSHDMRTPMNGILGMAALSKGETDSKVLHHNIEQIEDAGKYMLGLINDTLDVQKLDAGKLKLDLKVKNCSEIVETLVTMIKPNAQSKNIDFKVINKNFAEDNYSYIDELRIKQIFMNLASNAIKFTPDGGKVTFYMECMGEDDKVRHDKFVISDTGIGMSEKFIREDLFRPFEQEQNSKTTQYGGSGLGLSIVKSLVELMGGRIEVESKEGEGSTFTVYLDLIKVDKEVAEKIMEEEKEPHNKKSEDILYNKRILLCEDHPLNVEIASRLLQRAGCIVTVAHDGKEGVDMFVKSTPGFYHIILMDIRMPVMDGLQATKKIRTLEREDAKTVPIVAMTANAYEEDIKQCMESGMNAHIAKPLDTQVMYNITAELLQA